MLNGFWVRDASLCLQDVGRPVFDGGNRERINGTTEARIHGVRETKK